MNCDVCGKKKATVYCRSCGTSFCMSCHKRFGSVGLFKGKCGKCGATEVIKKG